jgi:hypothetical protein
MTFSCGISPNGVYHTATAYGQLLSSSGARSPGYSNSEQGCVNCLISAGDTETLPILQDDQWNFQYDLQYICSAAGVLASVYDSVGLGLHRATYKATQTPTTCQLNLTCPAGTTARCGTPSFDTNGAPCKAPWLNVLFLGITGRNSFSCYGVAPNKWSLTQGTCD